MDSPKYSVESSPSNQTITTLRLGDSYQWSESSLSLNDPDEEAIDSENEFNSAEMDGSAAVTGLTMKEYDEQLKKLTSENFHLKLKIYFMDNRISKMEGIQDKDLIKENIELRVAKEALNKELESKSKLLYEASEAFELLQKEHADEVQRLDSQFAKERSDFELKLGALEASLRVIELRSEASANSEELISYRNRVEALEERLRVEDQKFAELKGLESVYQDIADENTKLKEEISALRNHIPDDIEAKQSEINSLKEENTKACATIKCFVKRVQSERREKEHLNEEIKEKDRVIEDLSRLLELQSKRYSQHERKMENSSDHSGTLTGDDILHSPNRVRTTQPNDEEEKGLAIELEAKKNEIQKLNSDLKKRTHCLQELVNKELWDKNRYIEKLEKRLEEIGKSNSEELESLKVRLEDVSEERNKLSKEITVLRDREDPLRQACCILITRLEELADFLDSLLTIQTLHGLDLERHNVIREAVERSRELSRNLTLSLDDNLPFDDTSTITSQSLVISKLREQLSILTEQVRQRDIELSHCHGESVNKSIDQGEEEESEYELSIPIDLDERWLQLNVEGVEEERQNGERRRSGRFNARTPEKLIVKHRPVDASESEAWSEPDRNVSLARMGRLESSATPLRLSKCTNSSDSSDGTLNESRTPGKRTRSVDPETRKLQIKVKHLEESNKSLKEQIVILENKHSILNKLGGESAPQLLLEIQQSLTELEETRNECTRLTTELAATRGELAIANEDFTAKEQLCKDLLLSISSLESKIDEISLEYELRLLEVTQEKETAEKRGADLEDRFKEAEVLRKDLEQRILDIDKKVSESRRIKTESSAQVREAAKYADTAERLILDAKRDKVESEKKVRDLLLFVENLKTEIDEKAKELDDWAQRASREKEETFELRRKLLEAERSKVAVELKVKEGKEQIQWMEGKLRELEQAMDQCDRDTQARIAEEVKRGVDAEIRELYKEWVPRVELEKAQRSVEELEGMVSSASAHNKSLHDSYKVKEDELLKRISRVECEKRDLRRQLDDLRVRGSEMELECSRLAKEKVRLEECLRKAAEKQNSLRLNHQQAEEKFLHTIRNLEKQIEDEAACISTTNEVHRNHNTSPDLGIDSDHGRFSSLEHQDQNVTTSSDKNANGQLEEENIELKRRLITLQQTLEHTLGELTAANHYKKQMERAVCKQLHKTHHILKKARINFEMQDSDSVEERH